MNSTLLARQCFRCPGNRLGNRLLTKKAIKDLGRRTIYTSKVRKTKILNIIDRQMKLNPYRTNALISFVLMGLGDFIQQSYFNDTVNWKEVIHFGTVGLILGPICVPWYRNLEKWFPGKAASNLVKKVAVDEILWGPVYATIIFYILPLVESYDHQTAFSEWKQKIIPACIGSALFFSVIQSINFRFVPVHYQIAYLMFFGFIYDTAAATYKYQY